MKLRSIILPLLAVSLIASAKIGSANAYFTTHVTAKGYETIRWEHNEKIEEEYHDSMKHITIRSTDDKAIPVFVRAKVFYGGGYMIDIKGGDDWKKGPDDYYYYQKPLPGGGVTSQLIAHIINIPNGIPQIDDNYNIVVVYESVPATFNQVGDPITPESADWSQAKKN